MNAPGAADRPQRYRMRGKEAAEYLGITERTLKDWRLLRIVPYVRIGKTSIYDSADLDRVLAKYRVEAMP